VKLFGNIIFKKIKTFLINVKYTLIRKYGHPAVKECKLAADMNLLLSLNKIIVKFAGYTAIDELSFAVKKGQHWALTGKSGSGKAYCYRL
jgi:ABC-type molybdenum transport system ATPase subunit/photorepair protein PhrA